MKKIKIIVEFVLLLGLAGCVENQMMEYENDPAIYFFWSTNTGEQHDSINHSFFLDKNLMQDTVWIRVNAMGKTESIDRPVVIVQNNTGRPDAAIAGTHYQAFDSPGVKEKMIIPANAAYGLIPVVVLRHSSLDLKQVRLELEVAGNDYFRPGIDQWRNFLVTTTAQAEKPTLWDTYWYSHFGPTWGSVKFRFIIEHTGFTEWDKMQENGYVQYMRSTVLQKFAEYNRDNPNDPLQEANGDFVTF